MPESENDFINLPITDEKEMSWRWSNSKKPKSIFYKPEYSSGNGTSQIKTIF
ncbi:MAG: hypothetical protein NTU76_01335 [Candidatus Taylorbacteria bacterium]|nr:hypothetical protein [Candidatus Taylorbacteria bacterium]